MELFNNTGQRTSNENNSIAQALSNLNFFQETFGQSEYPKEALTKCAEHFTLESFKKGDTIFHKGLFKFSHTNKLSFYYLDDQPNKIYILLSGLIGILVPKTINQIKSDVLSEISPSNNQKDDLNCLVQNTPPGPLSIEQSPLSTLTTLATLAAIDNDENEKGKHSTKSYFFNGYNDQKQASPAKSLKVRSISSRQEPFENIQIKSLLKAQKLSGKSIISTIKRAQPQAFVTVNLLASNRSRKTNNGNNVIRLTKNSELIKQIGPLNTEYSDNTKEYSEILGLDPKNKLKYFKDDICLYKLIKQFNHLVYFGEQGVLFNKIRQYTVLAMEDTIVISIEDEVFNQIKELYTNKNIEKYAYFMKFLSVTSQEILSDIMLYFKEIEFCMNDIIYKEGDEADSIYFIHKGQVKVRVLIIQYTNY